MKTTQAISSSESHQPRELILRKGSAHLSESELLALVLGGGSRRSAARRTAQRLLEECGGLAGLPERLNGMQRLSGFGPARKAAVLACVEIARRLARAEIPERYRLDRPEAVARYLRLRFVVAGQEVMGALYLNARNRLLCAHEAFRGTLDRAAVEPRPLLKAGLVRDAASMILFHTHPSGDPSPSVEDLAFTRRLDSACEVLGLRLLDHLIVGNGGSWLSLRARGGW